LVPAKVLPSTLQHGPELYTAFRDKQDGCIKAVIEPN
jgi:threonine dehydrogenase-like Zn-dependent dehydrogenase